jgi:carbamoyl-phosphate synthase small subunit
MKATLALENGVWYEGEAAGAPGETGGEVVFNTSMGGYQEILTDPSYAGQIVTMTAPEIGNYGTSVEDGESRGTQVAGFIVREESPIASNWRSDRTLRDYLIENKIVAISGIDTRALVRVLRSSGVMRGIVATGDVDPRALVDRAQGLPSMEGSDLVLGVTCEQAFDWIPPTPRAPLMNDEFAPQIQQRKARRNLRVAAYDYGMKWNILRRFTAYGCDVRVFPATAPASELIVAGPDGVFLSNGPGDPAVLSYAISNARKLVDSDIPVFGICLGHQVLALAMGGETFKLKFGHRGGNHPVQDLATGKVEITSQNHGFAVDPESLPPDVKVTHKNLYDGTVEGLRHETKPVFCVQYHPEAAPGPHDADYLFKQFVDEMERRA